jgi:CubicO group peptidase (beta-lactamase class C family)
MNLTGPPRPTPVEDRDNLPLLFEPGTDWRYGASIDWAGRLVEILSGEDLETYFQRHVLKPVGVTPGRVTFFPERVPGTMRDLASMSSRNQDTERVEHSSFLYAPPEATKDRQAYGGEGGFADLTEYMKVVWSFLVDDGKLLNQKTAALMFQPWLKEKEAKKALLENVKHPEWIVGWVPLTGEYDWGLGGLLVDGDGHEHRKRGFMVWGGAFNLTWVSDEDSISYFLFLTLWFPPFTPFPRMCICVLSK